MVLPARLLLKFKLMIKTKFRTKEYVMNIIQKYSGSCRICCGLSECDFKTDYSPNNKCLQMSIPFVFTEISTVDAGISQVRATGAYTNELKFKIISRVIVRPFEENCNSDTIIKSRPIRLNSVDKTDNNPLVFTFCIEPINSEISLTNFRRQIDGNKITIEIDITFSNLSTVILEVIVVPNLSSSELRILTINRVTTSYRAVFNLFLLILYVIGVTCWSYYLNSNIYQQNPTSAKIFGLLLGSFVTFLGLSLIQIKNWIKTIANISGLLKYPEIHLPPSTHKFFMSITGMIVILIFISFTGYLTYSEHSLSIPTRFLNNDFAIYDSHKRIYLDEKVKRIYLKDFKINSKRFKVVFNSIGQNQEPKEFYILGSLKVDRGLKNLFSAKFVEKDKSFMFASVTKHFTYSNLEQNIKNKEHRNIILNALKGKLDKDTSCDGNELVCSKKIDLNADKLFIRVKSVGSNIFNSKPEKYINIKRHDIYDEVDRQLRNLFSENNYYISEKVLIDVTNKFIKETSDYKQNVISNQEVKNLILLRALWNVSSEYGASFNKPQGGLESIAKYGKQRILKLVWPSQRGHRPLAAFWEFLLELECLYNRQCGDLFFEAVIGKESENKSWLEKQEKDATARLMHVCLKLKTFETKNEIGNKWIDFMTKRKFIIKNQLGQNTTDEEYMKYFQDYFNKIDERINKSEEIILKHICIPDFETQTDMMKIKSAIKS